MVNFRKTTSFLLIILACWGGVGCLTVPGLAGDNNSEKRSPNNSWLEKAKQIFFDIKKDSEPPGGEGRGGTRSDDLCPIVLSQNKTTLIFNKNPLFIWEGEAQRITVIGENEDTEPWPKNVSIEETRIPYNGETLEPGKIYHVVFYNGDYDSDPYPFVLVDGDRRKKIESELQVLEREIESLSVEDAAMRLANFFLKRGLFLDALEAVYSLEDVYRDEFRQEIQPMLREEFCKEN